jgi:hypothetical protein
MRYQVHGQCSRPHCDGRDTVTVNGWTEDRWLKTAGFIAIGGSHCAVNIRGLLECDAV